MISKNPEYFWVTANQNAVSDIMFPIYQVVPRALFTPPQEVLPYQSPICRTDECSWDQFTSLAICIDTASKFDNQALLTLETYLVLPELDPVTT
jgi:hypothetical protein